MRTVAVIGLVIGFAAQAAAAPPSFPTAVANDAPALYDRFGETVGPLVNQGSLGAAAAFTGNPTLTAAIPGLFDTGVGNDGAVLPGGSVDPHYALIASADPAYPGPNAIVASLIPAGFWYANNTLSKWIAPTADENYPALGTPHPAGAYTYRLSFDLTGFDPQSAAISGSWGADNGGSIQLNGLATGLPSPSYSPLRAFALSAGFVAGINTLDFIVNNASAGGANPTGLRVEGLVGTAPVVGVLPAAPQGTLALSAPWPNPATGLSRIAFSLSHPGRARLWIRDVAGRLVRTLADRNFAAGRADVAWDGATDGGGRVPAGVYFVELQTAEGSASRRIVWLR